MLGGLLLELVNHKKAQSLSSLFLSVGLNTGTLTGFSNAEECVWSSEREMNSGATGYRAVFIETYSTCIED